MPALISLHRPWNFVACARSLKVQVDGARVGTIMPNQTWNYEVKAGDHVVRVTMGWYASPPVSVTVKEGETISLIAGFPNMFTLQGFCDSLFVPLLYPKRYLILYRADGLLLPDPTLPQPSNYPRPL